MNQAVRTSQSHQDPPLVLVVDDDPDARALYGRRLRQAGYALVFAASGEDAVYCARNSQPDAVVMDLGLEGRDGWWATRELRRDPAMAMVPIVVISGHTLPEHQRRAYECGCDLFLAKPCQPEVVVGILRGLIAKARLSSALQA